MKKTILTLIILSLINVILYAESGTSSAVFLKIYSDAKSAGIAGIGSVSNGNINLEQNPSSLCYINSNKKAMSFKFSHNTLIADMSGEFLQYGQNIDQKSAFGAYYKYIQAPNIKGTDINGQKIGTFSSNFSSLGLVYSRKITSKLNLGGTLKSVEEKIYDSSARVIAFDFSGMYEVNNKLSFGFSFLNIGSKMKVLDNANSLPLTYNIGASYLFKKKLLLLSEIEKERDIKADMKMGLEYLAIKNFSVRTGFKSFGEEQLQSNISLGFSYSYKSITVDYAYIPFQDVDSNHKLTLSLLLI